MRNQYRIRADYRLRRRLPRSRSRSYYAVLREIPAARLTPSELDYAIKQVLKAKPIDEGR